MELLTLGNSGGAPTKNRNCSCFILKFESYGIMFDCAEGSQRQLLKAGYKISKIRYIFISHMHADHISGLVPLLCTKSMFNIPGEINLIGPKGIKQYLKFLLNISNSKLNYDLNIIEIDQDEYYFQFPEFNFLAKSLNHRIFCLGYRLKFKDKPGNIQLDKLAELNLKPGPFLGILQKEGVFILPDGSKLRIEQVATPGYKGKIFSYVGDTYLCDNIKTLTCNADIVMLESTFQKKDAEKAIQRHHLTSFMCGQIAKENNIKTLIMYHFSASYTDFKQFKYDAQEVFAGNIELTKDLESIDLDSVYRTNE